MLRLSGYRRKVVHWNMMKNKVFILFIILIAAGAGLYMISSRRSPSSDQIITKEINPRRGDISITFTTTGVVEPQNRLEIKPPINGRIEEILVQEGDKVAQGDIVAWMSSTDRAALLDSARAQGPEALAYWKEVYKATPLLSPINGEVIVRAVETGQTVSTGDVVIVLSDRLIVKAQFDETDIGRVRLHQRAVISLDAYPDVKIPGIIDHIAYESKLVNNVTIYEVDIIPQKAPPFFRSGMSATVEVLEQSRTDVLLIPLEAIIREGGKSFVLIKDPTGKEPLKREITIGLTNGVSAEVVTGLKIDDTVILKQKSYALPEQKTGSSPFMFGRPKKKKND
jgi:macrolide-specific efflux system membrane fusion protein